MPIDLTQVSSELLEAELRSRRPVPRLAPPTGPNSVPRPASVLVNVVPWLYDPGRFHDGKPWDRACARLLSPISGCDALDIVDPNDVDDVIDGLRRARPLLVDPQAGWMPAHRGLGPRRVDDEWATDIRSRRSQRWSR